MAVDQFLAGTDLYRLQLQQSMAGAACCGGAACCAPFASPAVCSLLSLQAMQRHAGAARGCPTSLPACASPCGAAGDVAGEGEAAGVSPAVRMLQQNTRLGEARLAHCAALGLPASRRTAT